MSSDESDVGSDIGSNDSESWVGGVLMVGPRGGSFEDSTILAMPKFGPDSARVPQARIAGFVDPFLGQESQIPGVKKRRAYESRRSYSSIRTWMRKRGVISTSRKFQQNQWRDGRFATRYRVMTWLAGRRHRKADADMPGEAAHTLNIT
jgi:hypothetical protein